MTRKQASDIVAEGANDAPFNYLRAPLSVSNHNVTTALLLAGEVLAEPLRPPAPYPAPESAASEGEAENNFDWLLEIAGTIRQKLAEDPRRAQLLTDMIAAMATRTPFACSSAICSRQNERRRTSTQRANRFCRRRNGTFCARRRATARTKRLRSVCASLSERSVHILRISIANLA